MRRQYVKARNGGEPYEHFQAVHELMQGNGGSDLEEQELDSDSDGDGEADEDQSGMISESEGDGRCNHKILSC